MTERGPLLFALNASRGFGEAVSHALGVTLASHEEREFEDGEHKCRALESVRDRDVYVIQSLFGDAAASADDKLCRLLFFLGAIKDAAAGRVTAVVPYLAYARKDRRTKPRDPVTTRYVAALFEAVGTDCILTLDVHNLAAYQNAFRCRSEHLEAAPLFVRHLTPLLRNADVVVVSPDAGGMKRADAFRQRLATAIGRSCGAAFVEKYRSSGAVSGEALAGEVQGKVAVIVDDLISAGTTVAHAALACRKRGAERVLAAASHGVFADAANALLGPSDIERIVVTDTIVAWRVTDARLKSKIDVVSSAPLFAEAIRRLHVGDSMSDLSDGAS